MPPPNREASRWRRTKNRRRRWPTARRSAKAMRWSTPCGRRKGRRPRFATCTTCRMAERCRLASTLRNRPDHRRRRQLLPRRRARLADPVVQGRRAISGTRPQGARQRPAADRRPDDLHRRSLHSPRGLHAPRYRPPAAGNRAVDAAHGRDLLGGCAAPAAPAGAHRGALRGYGAAALPAPAARRRTPALRRPDRGRQLQHDQHARRVGLLPRPWHGGGGLRRTGAGRVSRPHRPRDADRGFRQGAERGGKLARERKRVDGRRIGIYGRATGALLAIHAAALDKRFKAVVAHPAAFNFADFFDHVYVPTWCRTGWRCAPSSARRRSEEGEPPVREELTLADVADRVDFPILSVCSADDETMPTPQSMLLKERVKGPVESSCFPARDMAARRGCRCRWRPTGWRRD